MVSAITFAQNPTRFAYGVQITGGQPDNTTPAYLTTTSVTGLQEKIPSSYIAKTEIRQAVNDANYTITGTSNQLIAYTAIAADRTVSLPAATTANQRIWITDESGLCSNARRIIVAPNGSDVIGGDSFAAITFPNGSGYLESNGLGRWNIISTTSIQFSAGVNTLPTITDNGVGGITLGSGVYSLYANSNGVGRPKAYQVAGGALSLTDQTTNYVIASYTTTTGVVVVSVTTVESTINNTTVIPICKVFRDGTNLHISDYDSMGLALSNKIQRSFEKTEPYRFQAGQVIIGESATRVITVSGGSIWQGGNEITLSSVASNVQTCYQFVNTSGTWSKSTVTQYNNTQYNAAGGLATLSGGKYGVIYMFRSVGQDTDIAYVLGTGDYSLGQAQTATIPGNLPTLITSHMVFVGRIIVLKSDATSTQIDSANTTGALFTTAGITDHNALQNLQTAQTGVTYGHINDATQTIVGNKTFSGNTALSGVSTAPTASLGTNTTQIASTAFVLANAITASGLTTTAVPKWSGSALVNGSIYDGGSTVSINANASINTTFPRITFNGTGSTSTVGSSLIGISDNANKDIIIKGLNDYGAVLSTTSLSAVRTFSYPNSSGVLALTSNPSPISATLLATNSYTVSTLPSPPSTGAGTMAYVTDALTPSYLVTVVGGGSVVTPVFYNGASWVAH